MIRHFIFSLMLLFSASAFSQESSSPTINLKTTSEMNREGKRFELNALFAGTGMDRTAEAGFVFGYYLGKDSVLELELGLGNNHNDEKDPYTDKTTQYGGIAFKRFFGNSFYARGGFRYTSMESRTNFGYGTGYHFTGERLSGSFALGNQWQWKNFTFGIDWVAVSGPISASFSKEGLSGLRSNEMLEYEKNRFARNGFITSPNIYIGASF